VFFSGCSLRCVFCQNREIRSTQGARACDEASLGKLFLALQAQGAHNINLVTPTHYADVIADALTCVRDRLTVPVVWNCGGYESVETLRRLEGLVDIYLPDFKYISPEAARAYSAAPDYAEVATAALREMVRQVGAVRLDAEGIMTRGVIVRHLVLPGGRKDSMAVLDRIAETVPVSDVRLSLMRQYTPDFCPEGAPAVLKRRVTTFEYDSVMRQAIALGFEGYFQTAESVGTDYTPDFSHPVWPI
jgi:putative pyruvate formate lyase activating enzyme